MKFIDLNAIDIFRYEYKRRKNLKTGSSLQLSELIDKNEFDRAFVLGKRILQESPDARVWESLLRLYVLRGEEDNRILPFLRSVIKKVPITALGSFLPQLCYQIRSAISIQLYTEAKALIELWAKISEILGDGKLTERLKGYLDYLSGVESIRHRDLEKAQSSLMSSHSHFLKFGLEAEVKVSRILSSSIQSLNIIINITNYGGLKEVRDVLKNQLSEIEKSFGRPPYFFDVREIEDRHDCFLPENELMQFIWDYSDNVSAALELRKGVFKLSGFDGWKDRLKGEKLNVWIPYLDALEAFLREFDKSIFMTGHMNIDTIQLKEQKRLLRFLRPKDVLVADMGDMASNVNLTTQAVERISRILERLEEKEASIKKAIPDPDSQILKYTDKQSFKTKAKGKLAGEKYQIFISHKNGVGVKNLPISKKKTEEYLDNKSSFEIFIYNRTVYKKVSVKEKGKTKRSLVMTNLDDNVFQLLLSFLIYKDRSLYALPLYHKAWEGSPLHKTTTTLAIEIMDDLKQGISQLRKSFKDVEGFEIPRGAGNRDRRRGCTYSLKGNLKFCLILEESELSKYIFQEGG